MLTPPLCFQNSIKQLVHCCRCCALVLQLNGAIPREMGGLHFLVELRLRENKLVGKIPPLLSNMCSLQVLDLTSNLLQGHIPESLGGMTELRQLWLGCVQRITLDVMLRRDSVKWERVGRYTHIGYGARFLAHLATVLHMCFNSNVK